jgi:pimeloyl-ACP methyl ester carboxylesterase
MSMAMRMGCTVGSSSAVAASPTTFVRDGETDAYGPVGRSAWLDVDWREHQRWAIVQGQCVNYVEMGSGPTVLFVHGLGGCWQNWLENLCDFARDHRVLALDLPGFGESEMPAEKISIANYGRLLEAFCTEVDVEAAAVVGNSMGGFVGIELAISCPQRVERLVLVSAAGLSIEFQRNERALALLRRTEGILGAYTGWVAARSQTLSRRERMRRLMLAIVASHPDRLPAPLVAEQVRGTGRPGFVDALDALTDYPIRDRLDDIACPALIVWGTDDRLVPLADADEFERLIPDARKVIYADTGHVPQMERPARFNADLRAFLEEAPGDEQPAPQPRGSAGT